MHYSGITPRELYAVVEKIPKSGNETSLGYDMSTYYSVYASNFTCRCEFFLLLYVSLIAYDLKYILICQRAAF